MVQRYVFIEMHEIFFGEFSIILIKLLEILVENTERYCTVSPRNWTLELVRQLNFVSTTTYCMTYFWLNSILGGYITKFVVDCTQSYSVAERNFFKVLRGRFMKALGTWIKMLM
jgi:hypothetical protein